MADILVGHNHALKTLGDLAINLRSGNRYLLDAESFALAKPLAINISGVTIDAIDPNNRPAIVYGGGMYSHAFELHNGIMGVNLRNLKVSLPSKSWAIRPCGQGHLFERIKVTQGGLTHTQAGDIARNLVFNQCKAVGDHITDYFAYVGGDVDGMILHDCESVPHTSGAIIRLMTGKNITIKGGTYVQDYPTGQRAQAIQLRGKSDLVMDGATVRGGTCGAFDIGWLPWEAGSQYTTTGVVIKNSTILGYIYCQPGTINAQFINNKLDAAGAGGEVCSLKGDQTMYNPTTKTTALQKTGRPHASATFTKNVCTGQHFVTGNGFTDGGGNLFNGKLTKPIDPSPVTPIQP